MKNLVDFILEAKSKAASFKFNSSENKSLGDVLSKLVDANKIYVKQDKEQNDRVTRGENKWQLEPWKDVYCSYLALYNWNKLNKNNFNKIDANTKEWEDTMNVLLKNNKNGMNIAFFENAETNNFDAAWVNNLFCLNFNKEKTSTSAAGGCYQVFKTNSGSFNNATSFSNEEVKKILKNYNIYVALGQKPTMSKPARGLYDWENSANYE